MKKFLFSALLLLCLFPLFASTLSTGVSGLYSPVDAKLFSSGNLKQKDSYHYALTAKYVPREKFSVTETVIFNSLTEDYTDIEFITYFSFRKQKNRLWYDVGCGIQLGLENAVEGSDKLYLTANGTMISRLHTLGNPSIVIVTGIIRPYFSMGCQVFRHLDVSFDYSLNLYHGGMIIPEGNILDLIGLGSVSLSVYYRF